MSPAYALIRGHEAYFDPERGWWRWSDTGELMGDPNWQAEPWVVDGLEVAGSPVRFPDPYPPYRGCAECGRLPTAEGHDACLGTLPGIVSACCGHGGRDRAYRRTAEEVEQIRRRLEGGKQ